jgi:hypothetical protein
MKTMSVPSLVNWLGIGAVVFTVIGALCGLSYVVLSRPLRRAEEREKIELQGKVAAAQKEAGEANEHAGNIERDNLLLRGQIVTLETNAATAKRDVARLQKAASDAKAAQQKVEKELAVQQELAATAEKALLEVQERVRPHHLTSGQKTQLVELFKANPGGAITISCLNGNRESSDFARELAEVLTLGGWHVNGPLEVVVPSEAGSGPPVGVSLTVAQADKVPSRAVVLQIALERIGLSASAQLNPNMKEDDVSLFVGVKPETK